MAHDIAKAAAFRAQHPQAPVRLGGKVQQVLYRQAGRGGQVILQILVALAQDLQVQRQDQCRTFRRLGPCDHACDEILVPHHIKLEPEGLGCVGSHILDRTDRHSGQGEGHAELFCRARRLDLAIRALHPGHAHRGQRHRHRHRQAHHGRGGAAPGHVHSHLLAQAQLREIAAVLAEGLLGIAAAFAIVIEHARGAPAVDLLEIVDAGDDGHGHGPSIRSGQIFLPAMAAAWQCTPAQGCCRTGSCIWCDIVLISAISYQ